MAPSRVDSHPTLHEQFISHGSKVLNVNCDQTQGANSTKGPDIDWLPSFENYQERVANRLKHGNLVKELPNGFPVSVQYPMRWTASELSSSEYVYKLSSGDIDEIDDTLKTFRSQFPIVKNGSLS